MYLRNLIVDGTINFNKIRRPGLKKKKRKEKQSQSSVQKYKESHYFLSWK